MRIKLYRATVVAALLFMCGILFFLLPSRVLNNKASTREERHHSYSSEKHGDDYEIEETGSSGYYTNNFTAVIVLTQIRSGSSFTGEVLQQHKDSFYVFEPIRALQATRKSNGSISFLNGTVRVHDKYEREDVLYQALLGWFTCNFSLVYTRSLLDLQFLSFGKKTMLYSKCIKKSKGLGRVLLANYTKCLDLLKTQCMESKYRIIKTIRTPMSMMPKLFEDLQNVKVIHLVRDPRAQVASLKSLDACYNFIVCIYSLCAVSINDTNVKLSSLSQYPSNFFTLKYEDLVENPVKHFTSVYTFLGIPLTREIERYVTDMTGPGGNQSQQCEVCKMAWQNGSLSMDKHINGWKQILSSYEKRMAIKVCHNALQHYNYI